MLRSLLRCATVVVFVFAFGCDNDEGPEAETFSVTLTGAAERPNPVNTAATGSATFTVNGQTVDFSITVNNIVGARLAHIHGPAAADGSNAVGVAVTLLVPIAAPGTNIAAGVLSSGTFPSANYALSAGIVMDSVLAWMRTGRAYVNVHTVANGGGEIRGTVVRN
ncbi:MAG: CHRD domain-containing protein [Gemmatimonadetes bacterium]|nr:CHRD domain-containing protein [Gemmatimonadota bacterium]